MANVFTWLEGKKTYFVAAAAGVALFLKMIGVPVPTEVFGFLGVTVVVTAAAKINRLTTE